MSDTSYNFGYGPQVPAAEPDRSGYPLPGGDYRLTLEERMLLSDALAYYTDVWASRSSASRTAQLDRERANRLLWILDSQRAVFHFLEPL